MKRFEDLVDKLTVEQMRRDGSLDADTLPDPPGYLASVVADGGTWGSGSDNGSHEDRGPEGTRAR